MHPLFAQLLQRRTAQHESIPGHIVRMTLPPSREMSIRRPGAATRPAGGMGMFMNRPTASSPIDILLEDLQTVAPTTLEAAPPSPLRALESEGVHLRIDPQDHQRVRISGSMREVCAALDALIAVQ
jgi:hypothetical protein